MAVIAMTIVDKVRHPHADALWIYTVEAGAARLGVVANEEVAYAVGEVAAVAEVGTALVDGPRVGRAVIRGVVSSGLMLGPTALAPGERIDALERAADSFVKWPSIEQLHGMWRSFRTKEHALREDPHFAAPEVSAVAFRAKIKLDGTNAGLVFRSDGSLGAQSRSRTLGEHADNGGFFRWVTSHEAALSAGRADGSYVLFGEWCGPGIQKGAAITRIERKVFAVFAVYRDGAVIVEPEAIAPFVPAHPDVFVLPFCHRAVLDLGDKKRLAEGTASINAFVKSVEAEDPWVKATFGVSGPGEGVVYYPEPGSVPDGFAAEELMFKAKGTAHRVVRQKQAAQVDPEIAESIEAFVANVVTPQRLAQMLDQVRAGAPLESKMIGAFVGAVGADCKKETAAELEAAGLTWKQVSRGVAAAARAFVLEALAAP